MVHTKKVKNLMGQRKKLFNNYIVYRKAPPQNSSGAFLFITFTYYYCCKTANQLHEKEAYS